VNEPLTGTRLKAKIWRISVPEPQLSLFGPSPSSPSLRDVANAVREAGIDGLPDARRRADEARYQEVQVRSAITSTKGMPFKWALNPYRGCTHACEYCYARKYQRHLELGAGDDFSSFILVKTNLARILAREIRRASWGRESVAVGTATDPYQPIEGHYQLTRQCLEVLADADTPFSIITKGPMVVRDIDVLQRASRRAGCRVFVSVATVDPTAWARLEPGTAPPEQRLRAARQLRRAGIDTSVLMMPLVPGITTSREQIRSTLRAIEEAGVPLAGANVAHLEPGVREHFLGCLEREYPSLVAGYERLYEHGYARADYRAAVRAVVDEARTQVTREIRTASAAARPPTSGCEP
jgi:DNA repair photolyase